MKNIWIFNHYATKPDEPATRAYDFGKELVGRGHKVTIFASSFSHYKLKEKYLDPKEKYKIEDIGGVRFFWIKTFSYQKNNWKRGLNMLSYGWRVFRLGKKLKEKPDVIIGTSVHPFAALAAYLVAKTKKCRFIFEVTDVWPQTLIDIGFFSSKNPLVFLMRILEKFLYKKAERIITFPPYVDSHIVKMGIPKEKIVWIPNAVNLLRFKDVKPYNGGGPNFIFMYSGIHSPYAGLETVIKAAEILQKEGENKVKFILVGDGSEKIGLIKLAEELNLSNVEFHEMVPKSEVVKVLEKADVFISIIKDIPVLKYGVSSNKLNDYLAMGRPIIFAVGAKNNPVQDAAAGLTVPPDNEKALAEAIKKMISLKPEERIIMARNGRNYAEKYLDVKILAEKLEKIL